MANVVYFNVDDSSPQISYSPFADTLSLPNLSGGWNPYYDDSGFADGLGETGRGSSAHITAHDGAAISIRWRGTGIQLVGNATQASYTIALDGDNIPSASRRADFANDVLVTLDNLQDTEHTLTLTADIPSADPDGSFVVFRRALITSPSSIPRASTSDNMTVAESDIAFSGRWSFTGATDDVPASHQTTTLGDAVQVEFNGTAVFIRGRTSTNASRYNVTLDGRTAQLSARSSFTKQDTLLFYATGLDPNVTHTVDIVNDQDGALLAVNSDGFSIVSVSSPPPSASPTPVGSAGTKSFSQGAVAACALGGLLAFLLLAGILFFLFVYRPKQRRRRREKKRQHTFEPAEKSPDHGPVLDIGPDPEADLQSTPADDVGRRASTRTNRTGFERWKDEVENKIAMSLGSLVFRHSHSGSVVSSIVSDSSSRRSKSKSNSPSIIIELPRRDGSQQSVHVPATLQAPRPQRSASDVTSLDYASTSAYPISSQCVGPSSSGHDTTVGGLLIGQPILRPQDRIRAEHNVPETPADDHLSPLRTFLTRTTDTTNPATPMSEGHDRGTFLLDDGMSIFGRGGGVRQLSPRTSVADDARPSRRTLSIFISGLPLRMFRRRSQGTYTSDRSTDASPSRFNTRSDESQQALGLAQHPRRASRQSGLSVRFEEGSLSGPSTGQHILVEAPSPNRPEIEEQSGYAGLRLTPPGIIVLSDENVRTGPSPDVAAHSGQSSPDHTLPQSAAIAVEGATNDTGSELSDSKAGSSSSGQSNGFPYPVSVPPSAHLPRDARLASTRDADVPPDDSPTDTLPVSISDVHFQQDTDGESWTRHSTESVRRGHPPLPRAPAQTYVMQRLQGRAESGSLLTPLGPRTPGQPHDRRGGMLSVLGRSKTASPAEGGRSELMQHHRTGSTPLGPRSLGAPHRRSTSVPFTSSRTGR
ncbi:hypothetical protein BD626DRAFT_473852 [Schizophyllum amplum]|uniref:Uncharacterized protein n=1 Tax=Schizophyllum amplum TaxID=97359 RepID=A0A550CX57_9AGAR|nr:hypothetical protein BD626DRAFT_473852 [Auriculariopsis ampla]